MSSEQLADGVNPLDAELAATWDVLKGYSGRDTDLGIARRFGGAAAAYSLRDIGAMNGRVVRVRRDVDGDGTDKEEDFSANQVSSGALEDWVNGKLESTLPADVATAAAAYSLRKVRAGYGAPTTKLDGSDGFPSNLNDLPLGNYNNAISGSTFTVGHFSTNFSAADSVSLSLGNNSFILRADKATSGAQYGHVIRVQGLSVGKRYTVTGEFRVIKGNGSGTVRMAVDISDSTSGTDEKGIATTNNYFTPFEVTALFNDAGANKNFIDFTLNDFGGANSGSGPIEGEFRNIKIVESDNRVVRLRRSSDNVEVDVDFDTEGKLSTSSLVGDIAEQGGESGQTTDTTLGDFISGTDAFVHTWYDQAGSNDAVQATAANQPKIAESGSLLADGLLFDGSNDSFEASDITNVNFPATVVSVSETNSTGTNRALYSLNNDSDSCTGFYRSTNKYAINNATTTVEGSATYTTNVHRLKFDLFNGASSAGFSNAVSDISGDIGTTVSQVTHFRIAGSLKSGITTPHSGTIKEIILYTSDQTDNRFKIESNINNYYGLYTFQGDGFVETWYDQSASGNDATQTAASQQPKIIENGGIIKNVKGFPSIKFESTNSTELDIGLLISNLNSVSAYVVTQKDDGDTNVMAGFTQGVSSDHTRFYLPFYTGGTTPNFGYDTSASKITFGTTITGTCNLYSAFAGDTNIEAFKNGSSVGTTPLVDKAVTATTSKIGQLSNSFYLDGKISEIFITTKKLQDDAATINSNVTSYYNL